MLKTDEWQQVELEIKDLGVCDFKEATMHLSEELPVTSSIGNDFIIMKINIPLKRIYGFNKKTNDNGGKYLDTDSGEKHIDVEHFWIKKGNTIIWEW